MQETQEVAPPKRRIARRTVWGALLVAGLAFAPSAAAAPKLVSVCASGCDFTSINAAANDPGTNAGDGIQVMPGTYTEQVSVPKQLNIFGSAGGARPVISSAANSGTTLTIASSGAGTSLSNLDIRGIGTSTTALMANGAIFASDLALSATSECVRLGGSGTSQLGPGVTATTSAAELCIEDRTASTLTGITITAGTRGAAGVLLDGGTLVDSTVTADVALESLGGIARRTTLDGVTAGVIAGLASVPSVVSDSVVTSTAAGGAGAIADQTASSSVTAILKLRNVTALASGSGSYGLEAQALDTFAGSSGGPGVIDARNVIARGEGTDVVGDLAWSPCFAGFTCQNGQVTLGFSNFATSAGFLDTGSVGHNQSGDPSLSSLVNPVVGPGQDFHVACSGSPLIGAGVADAAGGSTDRDGVSHSNPPSIGAYEFVSGPPCGGSTTPGGTTGPGGPGTPVPRRCKKVRKKHVAAAAKRKCRKRRRPG